MAVDYNNIYNQLNQGVLGYGDDPELAAAVQGLFGAVGQGQQQAQNARTQLESDYSGYTQQTKQAQDRALKAWQNRAGYTGAINSGVYLKQQGDIGNEYQQMLQSAAQRRSRGLATIDEGESAFGNDILNRLSEARAGAAGRRAESERQRQLAAAQQAFEQRMFDMQQQALAQQEALMRRLGSGGQYQPAPPPPPPPPAPPAWQPNPAGIQAATQFVNQGNGSDYVSAYNYWAQMNNQPPWQQGVPLPPEFIVPPPDRLYGSGPAKFR